MKKGSLRQLWTERTDNLFLELLSEPKIYTYLFWSCLNYLLGFNGTYETGNQVAQFKINGFEYQVTNMVGSTRLKCLRISVKLERSIFSIIMVTYLPTILMNILNQATNYLSGDSKYDMVITVNITSMMVLASIYLSVSTSLPDTPNIKPVEIWLLFNLAYPFFVILINITLCVRKKT